MSAVPCQRDLCLSRVMLSASGEEQSKMADREAFSLVSYNILADCHVSPAIYPYASPCQLDQQHRHRRLMEELRHLDADIVCLQEVGPDYYNQHLLPDMKSLGYAGEMKKRRVTDEGEATFHRASRFELQNSCSFYLSTLASKALDEGRVEEGLREAKAYLDRPDLVLVSRLRCCHTGKLLTVGNVHVVWNENLTPDVQTVQVACAITAVQGQAEGGGMPIVVCGDFNSEPSMPPYKLACTGSLDEVSVTQLQRLTNLHLADSKKTSLYEAVKSVKGLFEHSASLTSAYRSIVGREPEVTCYAMPVLDRETLDYVFYDKAALCCLGVLAEPSWLALKATSPGLPDDVFPSDHISQKALFAFV